MRHLLALLLCALLAGCGPGKPDGARPLVVGMDLSYPPFETIDAEGQPMGVSIELARALAEYLGRPLRIENIPFVGLIPSLASGQLDCVISSMTVTAERQRSISFSEPYLKTGLGLLVGADSPIATAADLDSAERTVVVRQGTTGEVWARRELNQAKILAVEKENAAVLEVIQGKADGFIYDQMSVWTNWKNHPEKTRAILKPLQEEEWAIGLRQGEEELLRQINEFLVSFRAQGGFDTLSSRFLPEQKKAFAEQGIPFVF